MSKIKPVYYLSNLGKHKCYTQSGSKKVYEDDGLTKEQSFIIFPDHTQTILSTGECEYIIGLKGGLENQHPWVDWTYTPPSNAVEGTTYSYTITGEPIPLSNYKGVIVTGVPTKRWTWDIQTTTTHAIYLSCRLELYSSGVLIILLSFNSNEYLGNDTLAVSLDVTSINPTEYIYHTVFLVSKKSKSPLKQTTEIKNDPKRSYKVEITGCNPMSGDNYQVIYD